MVSRPATPGANAFAPSIRLPSPETLALALAIVKATPAGVTSRDYVLQLRAHLKNGRRAFSDAEQGRYLDLVAFWRQKSETAEQRCRELDIKIAGLERSVHCLNHLSQDTSKGTPGDSAVATPLTKKGPASASKRPKRTRAQTRNPPTPEETLEDDLQLFEALGTCGMEVTQHYWTTQILLMQDDANVDDICGSVVKTTSALSQIFPILAKNHDRLAVRTIQKHSSGQPKKDKSELACIMSACARVWTLIIVALDKLEKRSPGSRHSSMVIFECIRLVSAALGAIRLAARQASWSKGSNPTASASVQELAGARSIAHLIATFIGHLEKDSATHHRLFEGIAYVLLERVGDQLYYCTFGCERGATVEERIALPPEPKNRHEVAHKATNDAAICLEVKALVIILERVMGVAPLHSNEQTTKKTKATFARTISLKSVTTTRTKLSSLAQERLQRTLITCAFGHKDHDDFVDILTKPVNMGRPPPVPKVKDEDVFEWYQSEVWRLVGWEILEKDGEWMT